MAALDTHNTGSDLLDNLNKDRFTKESFNDVSRLNDKVFKIAIAHAVTGVTPDVVRILLAPSKPMDVPYYSYLKSDRPSIMRSMHPVASYPVIYFGPSRESERDMKDVNVPRGKIMSMSTFTRDPTMTLPFVYIHSPIPLNRYTLYESIISTGLPAIIYDNDGVKRKFYLNSRKQVWIDIPRYKASASNIDPFKLSLSPTVGAPAYDQIIFPAEAITPIIAQRLSSYLFGTNPYFPMIITNESEYGWIKVKDRYKIAKRRKDVTLYTINHNCIRGFSSFAQRDAEKYRHRRNRFMTSVRGSAPDIISGHMLRIMLCQPGVAILAIIEQLSQLRASEVGVTLPDGGQVRPFHPISHYLNAVLLSMWSYDPRPSYLHVNCICFLELMILFNIRLPDDEKCHVRKVYDVILSNISLWKLSVSETDQAIMNQILLLTGFR